MKCACCNKDFPSELLHGFVSPASSTNDPICGICALKLSNEILHAKRRKFQGELAEEYRLAAIAHLKKKREAKK